MTHLDIIGKARYGNQLERLDPHPDANFFDHSIQSPTFLELLKRHTNQFIKSCGELQ